MDENQQNQAVYEHDLEQMRPDTTHPSHNTDDVHFTWEASEYILHSKTNLWFVVLGAATLVPALLLVFFMEDWVTALLLVVMGAAVFVYATRKPHTLQYSISDDGLLVGHREYEYGQFRSFSIVRDSGLFNVTLMPTKRFSPPLSIYFDERDAATITELLARHLPHVEREPDVIDRITRKLRF